MRKKIKWTLFISGLLIEFAALLGEHADEIPFILKTVAPTYFRAQIALETLDKNHVLTNTNVGFDDISPFLIQNIYEANNLPLNTNLGLKIDVINRIGITEIVDWPHSGETYSGGDLGFRYSSRNRQLISNGKLVPALDGHYHVATLREKVQELKNPNILGFCVFLFIFGAVVEFIAFFMEISEPQEKVPNHKPAGVEQERHASHEGTQKHNADKGDGLHCDSP